MPVVRYRTRDLTTLLPGTAYPQFRRMAKITGRSDDMMIVRGVNVFPSQIEEHILAIDGLAPHYLCVLTRPGRMDELTVRVEASAEAPAGAAATVRSRATCRPGQAPGRGDRSASRCSSRTRSSGRWARPGASTTSATCADEGWRRSPTADCSRPHDVVIMIT